MKGKRYTDEFKKEAVKQVTDRGYSVSDVAKRLGTTTHSLYLWLKKYGDPSPRQADKADLTVENARLKADLKRGASCVAYIRRRFRPLAQSSVPLCLF